MESERETAEKRKGEEIVKKNGRTMLAAAGKTVMALFMTLAFASTVFAADPFSPHWEIDRDQVWHYRMNDGSYASDAWIHDEVNGDWYLLDVNGNMLAGTFVSYGKYYLLATDLDCNSNKWKDLS